ncbi:HXXEE domain-containing protein [Streptococcus dysgalactiae]|uniref:HXXEE domain-containing protein n=1 Tax=Streptococcus dysgalactiae TaxID=1334 RepID=UPI0010D50EE5|nr:Uncharacterised protein [Streptococcus dysgalactiae subsp. equisimilis]VTS44807.1 Uncharacterised protein [Streptococcus dysgalactiae subsp. equisimilis]
MVSKLDSIKKLKIFLSIFFLHVLHQIEESLSFFNWYYSHHSDFGIFAILPREISKVAIQQPYYFIIGSCLQFIFTLILAFISLKRKKDLKLVSYLYIIGLDFFLIWHIISCYQPHLYPPIMTTCILGLFYTLKWLYSLNQN